MSCVYLGKMSRKFVRLLCVLMLLASGCGSSGNDSHDSPTCPGDPSCSDEQETALSGFVGTYEALGFIFRFENEGTEFDETDTVSWCGQMVITAEGLMMLDQTIDGQTDKFKWEILEITEDAIKINEENCEKWINFSRNGNDLTIIWPEGPCSEGFSAVYYFTEISDSGVYPPPEECIPQQGADPLIPDLTGTYETTEIRMTDAITGETIEMVEPDDTWSGRMEIWSSNLIDLSLTTDQGNYHSIWEIDQVSDSDSDGFNDTLNLYDMACGFSATFVYSPEEGQLALTVPASPCTDDIEMIYHFNKISDTVENLNGFAQLFLPTKGVERDSSQGMTNLFETMNQSYSR